MGDATLQSFRAASDATVEWLLAGSREDGSLSEANDGSCCYVKAPLLLLLTGHVVHSRRYNTQRARNQFFRMAPFRAMPVHVVHIAVPAVVEPRLQVFLGFVEVDVADA